MFCRRTQPVPVLHERTSRLTLAARLPSRPAGRALFKDRMICLLTDHRRERRRDRGHAHGHLQTAGARAQGLDHLRQAAPAGKRLHSCKDRGQQASAGQRVRPPRPARQRQRHHHLVLRRSLARFGPAGRRAASRTSIVVSDDSCQGNSTSTPRAWPTSRRSFSPSTSRRANVSATQRRSRPSSKALAKTSRSGPLERAAYALEAGIHHVSLPTAIRHARALFLE